MNIHQTIDVQMPLNVSPYDDDSPFWGKRRLPVPKIKTTKNILHIYVTIENNKISLNLVLIIMCVECLLVLLVLLI